MLTIEMASHQDIIVHLPIDILSIEIEKGDQTRNTTHEDPLPIMTMSTPMVDITCDLFNEKEKEVIIMNKSTTNVIKSYYNPIRNVMIPSNTLMIHCWHCCHPFDHVPIGIPIKRMKGGNYHVKGIFCSYSCALTYNYNERDLENRIQERESLIRMMAYPNVVQYAPQKELLKMFGGIMTIDEFKNTTSTHVITYPPMVPLVPHFEEIQSITTYPSSSIDHMYDMKLKENDKGMMNGMKSFLSFSPNKMNQLHNHNTTTQHE